MSSLALVTIRLREDLINIYKYLRGVRKEDRARLFSVVPSARTRGNGHKLKHRRFPLNMREHCLHCEGDQALAQVAQRGCGVSIPGDTQNPSGHGLGQPALGAIWSYIPTSVQEHHEQVQKQTVTVQSLQRRNYAQKRSALEDESHLTVAGFVTDEIR
ncbi:hypothetical protein QYF61_003635, partial [Mycteria americana]